MEVEGDLWGKIVEEIYRGSKTANDPAQKAVKVKHIFVSLIELLQPAKNGDYWNCGVLSRCQYLLILTFLCVSIWTAPTTPLASEQSSIFFHRSISVFLLYFTRFLVFVSSISVSFCPSFCLTGQEWSDKTKLKRKNKNDMKTKHTKYNRCNVHKKHEKKNQQQKIPIPYRMKNNLFIFRTDYNFQLISSKFCSLFCCVHLLRLPL